MRNMYKYVHCIYLDPYTLPQIYLGIRGHHVIDVFLLKFPFPSETISPLLQPALMYSKEWKLG